MNSTATIENDKSTLYRTKFCILIILQIPAILLILLIFVFFITHRVQLNTLQNQALLLLLIINFIQLVTDLPMSIHFYYLGYISPATFTYCTWRTFLQYTLDLTSELLMATISIQRHILIFQAHILHNRLKRFLLYYLPLTLCIIYPLIIYTFFILLYPCDGTEWDFTLNVCGNTVCYVYNKVLDTFDWIVNNGLPVILIILANFLLVLHVSIQKYRLHQPISWRKQRRMTLQLLSISGLYLFAWVPNFTIGIIQQLISPNFLVDIQKNYIFDFIYLVCLLLPWIYLGLLPGFIKWIFKYLHRCDIIHNAIRPV